MFTANIDSGVGGFTAFKYNEIINELVDKSTRFRQVCNSTFVPDYKLL